MKRFIDFEWCRYWFPRFRLDCPGRFAGFRLYVWPFYLSVGVRIVDRSDGGRIRS
jgi:hypothetical protein